MAFPPRTHRFFILCFMLWPLLGFGQWVVPDRDIQAVDSTNSGYDIPPTATVLKGGYSMISDVAGKYKHRHLQTYLVDTLNLLQDAPDSVFIIGDSICVVSLGDTLCVGQDSTFLTDSTFCIIQMGDTTCIEYDGAGGVHYFNTNLEASGDRTHDGNGFDVVINDQGTFRVNSIGAANEVRLEHSPDGGTTLAKMRLSDTGADFAFDKGVVSSAIIIDENEAGLYHSSGEYSFGGFFYSPPTDYSINVMLGLNASGRLRQSRALVPADTVDLVATQYDLSLVVGGGGSDSFFIVNDSVCAIYLGDTLCVSQDSFFITDSTICVIQLGDTTCVNYSSGTGNIYSINGAITDGQTRFVDIPSISALQFRKSNGTGNPFSTLRIGEGSTGNRMLKIENWTVSTEAPAITISNLNTGNIYQYYNGNASGQDYSTGVNRSGLSYVLGAGSNLTNPFISLYGAADSVLISKNVRIAADNQPYTLEVSAAGANAGSSQTTQAGYFSNTRTGTSSTNTGVYASASGGVTNYGVYGLGSGGSFNYGVYGFAGSAGVYGVGGQYGVRGEGSTSGVYGIGTTAFGVFGSCTTGTPLVGSVSAGSSVAPTTMLRLIKSTTSTPLDGIGSKIDFDIETSSSNAIANEIRSRWTTVNHATRTSQFSITGVDAATTKDILSLSGPGQLTLNQYTASNFNGGTSADSVLVITSAGEVKKRNSSAFGGGGGGDNWGSDVVNTDATLTGNGTVGNPLKVDTSEIATQYDLTLISGGGGGGNDTFRLTNTLSDGQYSGILEYGVAGATVVIGDIVYLDAATSRWKLTDADADATAGAVRIAVVITAGGDGNTISLMSMGKVRADSNFPTMTVGVPVYLSTTPGEITTTAPTGTGDIIRIIGYANTADELYFNPSSFYLTHI